MISVVSVCSSIGAGLAATLSSRTIRSWAVGRDRRRYDHLASHPRWPSSGSGRSCCGWAIRRAARAGAVLDHPRHRPGHVVDRSADHHHQLRRRADAHLGHRAGERRRRAVLDGLRPREGGAGGPGLQAGGELGGPDGPPRHHRPHAADGRSSAAASRSRRSFRSSSTSGRIPGASRSSRSRCAT